MAKKFGRNQKRKMREQLATQKIEADEALAKAAQERNTAIAGMRSQIRALDNRKRNQIVIDLAIDRDLRTMERSLIATACHAEMQHDPLRTAFNYDPHSVKYALGRDEQKEYVADLATMIARLISDDLFGAIRNDWGVGYGRDVEPYERRGRGW